MQSQHFTELNFSNLEYSYLKDLCFFLELSTILKLTLVNRYYLTNVSILLTNSFCQEYIRFNFKIKPKQLEGLTEFKQFLVDRFFAAEVIKEELEKKARKHSHSASIHKDYKLNISFFNKHQKGLRNFLKTTYTRTYAIGWMPFLPRFSILDIAPLILQDDAIALFDKVTRVKNVADYIINADLKTETDAAKLRELIGENITFADFAITNLLPCLARLRAIKCFESFVIFYLKMMTFYTPTDSDMFDGKDDALSFKKVCDLVFHTNLDCVERFIK